MRKIMVTPLVEAKYNQPDVYDSTCPKIIVPISRFELAASPTGNAIFTYVAAEQAMTQ